MLDKLPTEQRNPKTMDIDTKSIKEILEMMNREDFTVPQTVQKEISFIEEAVHRTIHSFKSNGRLIYIGAGTSGRLGVLDASECPPTFGVSSEMVKGLISGGLEAITKAKEGAEDSEAMAKQDLLDIKLTEHDTVIGIAASGRTPYVKGALSYANEIGASTVAISNNKNSEIGKIAEIAIEAETGPEVITGSTRLKAGTAQKLILNMISTASMIGVGKVYENLMVDLKPTNKKLVDRSKRIIMEATQVDYTTAENYLQKANNSVKTAIVMILLNCNVDEAIQHLDRAEGFIRKTK
ncbi:glucokinase regulatory protein-related protein [Oceanobacillus iheyensis HTE831]|uniref:N-acetylmuramic acid 6-phosphate etherase n=1 Tax=Oceanobacillus iheyensis (strain DSM 14371 / CIP 107618 / JCM 11309 / KCTC 3954 / HTE831) TaxID=221109 RepID=MURQ_OCEIH|nr:N-acetylmuramic acid 6-phosphate etherase [Oceanobacillus iheyensis]Q8ESL3.1 RecName: Full=N-acetylmuramic acid 6-phosphate etherase; Short=MurNAc-6-P etherase; AltName: Full=N-acetylmuramic acid 6-phosphate hydrolase; AltName: Full=N-acetylmuramic acid 6-phosphate lyase [Oceanobacillus iheyensis HTE831]BAC12570.1 glucokinase regulatory protein-related protein [Oceanobacillus iheyensis HTE831]